MARPTVRLHLYSMHHIETLPPRLAREINRAQIKTVEYPPAAADPLSVEFIPDDRSYAFVRSLLDRVPGIMPVDRSPHFLLHKAETESRGAVIAQPLAKAVLERGWPKDLMQWLVMPVLHRAFQVARDKEMAAAIKEHVDGYLGAHPDIERISVSHVQGATHDSVPYFLKALGCKLEVVEHEDPRYKGRLCSPLQSYLMERISAADLEGVFRPLPKDPELLRRLYRSGLIVECVDYDKLSAVFDKLKKEEVRKVLAQEKEFRLENPEFYK